MSQKDENINVRTSEKAKNEFLNTLKDHGKNQSYLINLLVDAYNAQPLECLIALERMKASKSWK